MHDASPTHPRGGRPEARDHGGGARILLRQMREFQELARAAQGVEETLTRTSVRSGAREAGDRGDQRRVCRCRARACACATFTVGSGVVRPRLHRDRLIPDAGGSWFIHRLLGFSRAFEWMVSNRRLSAEEALGRGLVSTSGRRTCLRDEPAAGTAARRRVAAMTKQLFEHAHTASLEEQLALEAALQQAAMGRRTSRRGVQAFLESARVRGR